MAVTKNEYARRMSTNPNSDSSPETHSDDSSPNESASTSKTCNPWPSLRQPFEESKVKQKPGRGQGGKPMSYISHGLVTEALLNADPAYEMIVKEVYSFTDDAGRMHCEAVLLRLILHGEHGESFVIEEVGTAQRVGVTNGRTDGFGTEMKNAISDALKRCAMRRGVALAMWESLIDAEHDEDAHPDYESEPAVVLPKREPRAGTTDDPPPPQRAHNEAGQPYVSAEQVRWLVKKAQSLGVGVEEFTRRVRRAYGVNPSSMTVDQAKEMNGRLDAFEAEKEGAARAQALLDTRPRSEEQIKRLFATAHEKGVTKAEIDGHISAWFGKSSTKDLTIGEAKYVIDTLTTRPNPAPQHTQEELAHAAPAF